MESLAYALGRVSLGDELAHFVDAIGRPPPVAIRLRPGTDHARIPFDVETVPWHSRAFRSVSELRPARYRVYGAAEYFIQDSASLLAIRLLDAQPGEAICDLCAAPGGKSTAILEDIGETGWLVANEAIQSRVGILEFSLTRHGSPRFHVTSLDVDHLASLVEPVFDGVLVDAPCSGQSLIGRGKQNWSSFSPKQIDHSAERQARILDAAGRLVRPGGRLVYATCTFADQENERQVERFLDDHPDFHLEKSPELAGWESDVLPGTYRLWPHRDQCGGAFAAKLRRVHAVADLVCEDQQDLHRSNSLAETKSVVQSRSQVETVVQEVGDLEGVEYFIAGPRAFAWPISVPSVIRSLCQRIVDSKMYVSGPEVAYLTGSTWSPSYALAMRRDPNWHAKQGVELSDRDANSYLGGNVIPYTETGWAIATWQGLPLGWVKGDGLRGKNHLPKQARLQISE